MMGRSDKERWRRTATIRSGKEESVYIWGNQVFGVDQGGGEGWGKREFRVRYRAEQIATCT